MGSPIVFLLLAIISIGAGAGMLLSRNAVHSALFLVLNFTAVGVLYLVLQAPFIAMVQITVYAGAIMVLFLFVIMLLGAERLEGLAGSEGSGNWQPLAGGFLTALLIVAMGVGLWERAQAELLPAVEGNSFSASPAEIGEALFANYVFPFEVTSILLLVAMIAIVVWRSEKSKKKEA
jgi:NADH-quinone oxidoreductase subunit J